MRWVERVCVNLECTRSRLAEDLHSLAGAVGNLSGGFLAEGAKNAVAQAF